MAYKSDSYTPQGKGCAILDRAWEHLQSVPYKPSARWLFYRLLQDGFYSKKSDYKNAFLPLLSRVRHNGYGPWRPDTLIDDRRSATIRGEGYDSPAEWAEAIADRGSVKLSRWGGQSYYLELWYEAEAMSAQFEYYTRNITLRPFFGMPSIPYKWDIAKSIEVASERYGLPVVIAYFGDLDTAGETIPETTLADIRGWCDVDFDFVRAGLNPGDEKRYNLPENFDHPGAYQWEALPDSGARELITATVGRYVDFAVMAEVEHEEQLATESFRFEMAAMAERWARG